MMNLVESERIFLQPHLYSDGLPALSNSSISRKAASIDYAPRDTTAQRIERNAGVAATNTSLEEKAKY